MAQDSAQSTYCSAGCVMGFKLHVYHCISLSTTHISCKLHLSHLSSRQARGAWTDPRDRRADHYRADVQRGPQDHHHDVQGPNGEARGRPPARSRNNLRRYVMSSNVPCAVRFHSQPNEVRPHSPIISWPLPPTSSHHVTSRAGIEDIARLNFDVLERLLLTTQAQLPGGVVNIASVLVEFVRRR